MDQDKKACIACAEEIQAQAALCRHCNTRQDDPSFTQPTKAKKGLGKSALISIVAGVSVIAVFGTVLLTLQPQAESQPATEAQTKTLANGVLAPFPGENSEHGYSLEANRIPRLETCEEWNEFWVYEGPAVSFEVADKYFEPLMAVSTLIYDVNQHLDEDLDGVICFFENGEKPLARPADPNQENKPENLAWHEAVMDVRATINAQSNRNYPLDFAVSPNVVDSHAKTIRDGVELALRFWGPFIDSDRPLAMTVVHPKDKQWFLERWEKLGRDNTGEFWWDLAVPNGGGAVGWTAAGIPNMYFMAAEQYPPPRGPVDYYVHEVTHFFQTVTFGAKGESIAPCWYGEGTANFIGFSMTYTNDVNRTLEQFAATREDRAQILMRFYDANGGLTEKRLIRDILNFPKGDDTCQHEDPAFGYNLGMFVSEKMIIDFGFQSFIDLTREMAKGDMAKAFKAATGADYESWVKGEAIPYVQQELPVLAG